MTYCRIYPPLPQQKKEEKEKGRGEVLQSGDAQILFLLILSQLLALKPFLSHVPTRLGLYSYDQKVQNLPYVPTQTPIESHEICK